MGLPSDSEESVDQFLFDLPRRPMTRAERLHLLKEAVADRKVVTQDHLDRVMTRLLEELQRTS